MHVYKGKNLSGGAGGVAYTRITEFKVIKGHNSENTSRTIIISLHAYLHISASMCTKFGKNSYSGTGGVAFTRFTEFKVIKGHNSENTSRTIIICFHAHLHISTSMCTKFEENRLSWAGVAITRRQMYGRTDGEYDDNI